MYCVTCGSLIDEKLNYCNRCGTRVAKGSELVKQTDATASVLENLSRSIRYVGGAGIGGFIGLIAILLSNHAAPELIVILSTLFLAATFAICFLLTRQISHLTGNLISTKENSAQTIAPEQLNAPVTEQIEAMRQPFASVTENTTRTLDEVLAKRN
jgi:hypothetical protein